MTTENQNLPESNSIQGNKKFRESGFLKAQKIAKIGNYGWVRSSNEVFWSDELYRIFEYDPKATPPSFEAFIKLLHPDDVAQIISNLEESNQKKNINFYSLHRLLMQDGRIKYVEESNETEYSPEGEPIFTHGTVQDVTERMLANETIRRNQQMLERTEKIAHIGSWEWDVVNDVVTWSSELYRIYQLEPNEGISNYFSILERYNKEDGIRLNEAVEAAIKFGTPYSFEIEINRKDGTRITGMVTGHPEKDLSGKVVRLYGTFQDISDRKKGDEIIRASESKFRLLFENINAGIAIFDPEGNFILVNERYAQIINLKPKDFIGKSIGDVIPIRAEKYYQRFYKVVREKKGAFFEDKIPTNEGFIWLSSQLHPNIDSNGNVTEVQLITFSITEQKEAEEALIKLNTELEGRVDYRTAELRAARDEAELANRAKSLFLANMSHEIRTPLNGALGMLNLLQRTDLNKRQSDYVAKAQVSTQTLLGIINNILDFSKIESGRMELDLHPFNVEDLIQRLAILSGEYLRNKNVEILFDLSKNIPPSLIGDELRLRQVLLNLIGNAMKFTQKGEVILKIESSRLNANTVTLAFSITDSGIGIPADKLEHIFEGFSQAESSTTREYGGTGLGLAISNRMVNLMGSNIQVHSEVGKGSTFSFKINLKTGDTSQILKQSSIPKVKILIINNNTLACKVLGQMIENVGWEYQCLNSEINIIEFLNNKESKFNLLLIDCNMTEIIGIEVIKQIKNIPIALVITSHEHELLLKNRTEDLKIFETFLIKPITSIVLLETIESLVLRKMNKIEPINSSPNKEIIPEYFLGAKILLAEDNQINQQIVAEILNDFGLKVDIADNGKKVVEMAKSNQYQLILMDMQMPVLDGIEATIQIRQQETLLGVPIIAMTANVSPADRTICFHAGMNDFLPKPFELDTLIDLLKIWLDPQKIKSLFNSQGNQTIKGFDMAKGLRLSRGNKVSYLKLLHIFVDQHLDDCKKIIDSMQLADKTATKFLIHNLKGSSAQIGATTLSELANSLEILLMANNSDIEFSTKLDELILELEYLGPQIKNTLLQS